MKNMESYLDRVKDIFDSAYSNGYSDGHAYAKEKFGKSKGIAHVKQATPEEIKKYGIELHGWCDCGKPIEGRWVGMANFCPWCGKIIEWEKPENKESAE